MGKWTYVDTLPADEESEDSEADSAKYHKSPSSQRRSSRLASKKKKVVG